MDGFLVIFAFNPQQTQAQANDDGVVLVDLLLYAEPGERQVQTTFAGDGMSSAASAQQILMVLQLTSISCLAPNPESVANRPSGLEVSELRETVWHPLHQ